MEKEIIASSSCGENATWRLDGTTLYIEGTGEMRFSPGMKLEELRKH